MNPFGHMQVDPFQINPTEHLHDVELNLLIALEEILQVTHLIESISIVIAAFGPQSQYPYISQTNIEG